MLASGRRLIGGVRIALLGWTLAVASEATDLPPQQCLLVADASIHREAMLGLGMIGQGAVSL